MIEHAFRTRIFKPSSLYLKKLGAVTIVILFPEKKDLLSVKAKIGSISGSLALFCLFGIIFDLLSY